MNWSGLPGHKSSRKPFAPIGKRLSLNRRFRCVPFNEFKAVAAVFCEEFAKQCNGAVSVEVKCYHDTPQFSTRLEHPDVWEERREQNERLVFKRLDNIEDIDEDSFLHARYVEVVIGPKEKSGELESAFGSLTTGGTNSRLILLYAQPYEVFGDTSLLRLKNLKLVKRKYRIGNGHEKDGATFKSDMTRLASIDLPALDEPYGLFGRTMRGDAMAGLLRKHHIKW